MAAKSMQDVLQTIVRTIADAKLLPDADLEFLVNLETQIIGRAGAAAQGQAPGAPGAAGGPAGLAGLAAGAQAVPGGPTAPGGIPQPPPGVAGLRLGAQLPNVDELRRLLGQ